MVDTDRGLRDYERWHGQYDDPGSALSWRLTQVQQYLTIALDAVLAPTNHTEASILSLCSGDGRDVLGVLRHRPDAHQVRATLVELHPQIAARARANAEQAGLNHVEVRTADAGTTSSLSGAAPADVVLLVGILGNISAADIDRTVAAAPQLCRRDGYLVWSRGRGVDGDRNGPIRAGFVAAGFTELGYTTSSDEGGPALGLLRYDGPPAGLAPDQRLFTFTR